jgi:hypothetical protein
MYLTLPFPSSFGYILISDQLQCNVNNLYIVLIFFLNWLKFTFKVCLNFEIVCTDLKFGSYEFHNRIHCRVPDKEWPFQDGGLYIIKKVGVKSVQTISKFKQTLKVNFSQLNNCYNSIHCDFLFVIDIPN